MILKLGEKGAFLDDGKGGRHFPGLKVEAVDATAAGDTFNGALAVALAEGRGLDDAIALRQRGRGALGDACRSAGLDPREARGRGNPLVRRAAVCSRRSWRRRCRRRAAETRTRRLSRAVLEDKIRGGWAGQMIGVAFGAPTEFQSNGKIIEGELAWTPESVANSIEQDDLYVEMTFAEVMDRVGPRRHDRGVRRDVPRLAVPALARQRRRRGAISTAVSWRRSRASRTTTSTRTTSTSRSRRTSSA